MPWPAREQLDNLIFVVNCNLQRLDGPVRGNGKIIQELEGVFRGAGWNVNKVVWGRFWDPLFAKDKDGILQRQHGRGSTVTTRTTRPRTVHSCASTSSAPTGTDGNGQGPVDKEIWNLNRGGHDPYKVYAAYHQAVNHKGQPTVILAKTIKGYGTGAGEAKHRAQHQEGRRRQPEEIPRPLRHSDRR